MIDISFFIWIPDSQDYDPRDDLLRKIYFMILSRRIHEFSSAILPNSLGIVTFRNKRGIKFGFLNFLETDEVKYLELIDETSRDLHWLMNKQIFENCKQAILRELIKSNEKIESKLEWNSKVKKYKSTKNLEIYIKEMEQLEAIGFINYAREILLNSKVKVERYEV
jgi:hypothetical protein